MKILFITHYFAPDSGAAAVRLTRLAEMLHARGHEITVLTTLPHYPRGVIPPAYRHRWVVVEEQAGVRVIHVWLWASANAKIIPRLMSQLSFMASLALRGLFIQRPDVILIENQPVFTGLAGWFISKVKRRSYVLNVSDFWPEVLAVSGVVAETSRIYRVFRWLTNLTQRSAAGIVVMYPPLLGHIESRIGTVANSRVIYNAVDLTLFRPDNDDKAFREKYALGDRRLITFLGVLGAHIDLETMLNVAGRIRREDVAFLFVGAGAQAERLREVLQREEYAHCRHIEWIDYAEVPGFWAASAIHFWALHHNELDRMRLQAKLFEALASGTPTVIAVDGLMSEILNPNEAGITVPPGDVPAMVNAIERLLDDPTYYQGISANARRYAEDHFDPVKTADAYEDILMKTARGVISAT